MNDFFRHKKEATTRRDFLKKSSLGFGSIALSSLLSPGLSTAQSLINDPQHKMDVLARKATHFMPKAKRVIYLFQSGGPSQIETYDYKPALSKWHGQEIPPSLKQTQRNSGMVEGQSSYPLVKSIYNFKQYGKSGAWISELFPYTASIADELCIIKSMYTDAINHEPAVMFVQTGSQLTGRPSIGSWLSYGLGSDNKDLPDYIVMVSKSHSGAQPLNSASWSNGFLPSHHQGVQLRAGKEPVLYLNNPHGVDPNDRKKSIDYINELNQLQFDSYQDPKILSQIKQYEMAYRMQQSVPDALNVKEEPQHIYDLYGEEAKIPGTYAANCLQARRLAERDVKFIQLYHTGWDQHGNLPSQIKKQALDTDRATAGLIQDLKQRGLLEETLVIWGGEFGRTSFSQGRLTANNYGRDHHPGCFTMWMAGGGIKAGYDHGLTDDFSYNIVKDPVHIRDFNATILHCLGVDHQRFTYTYQGLDRRLTGVEPAKVVHELLA